MKDLLHILAESATKLDSKGLFKEAELVDDMLQALTAVDGERGLSRHAYTTPLRQVPTSGHQLITYAMQLLAPLNASDAGASVALKHAQGLVAGLDQALSSAARARSGGEQVRLMAKEALKSFLSLSRGNNAAANAMFDPVLKPMVDTLRALSALPDEQMLPA